MVSLGHITLTTANWQATPWSPGTLPSSLNRTKDTIQTFQKNGACEKSCPDVSEGHRKHMGSVCKGSRLKKAHPQLCWHCMVWRAQATELSDIHTLSSWMSISPPQKSFYCEMNYLMPSKHQSQEWWALINPLLDKCIQKPLLLAKETGI